MHETPTIAALLADDVLEIALERAGLERAPVVPYEASAALAMLLLRDHGVVTVAFAGIPPGTSSLMLKFIPPETLERFGGAQAYAEAIDSSLSKLAEQIGDEPALRRLLLGA